MATLMALERNRYFFGKLMDVAQFQKEQDYFRNQQALLNRLVLGSGILQGLTVDVDPNSPGKLFVSPGVAIDPDGRLIVVALGFSLDPAQLTDDQGVPQGNPIGSGTVLIRLAYAETCADPVRVFVNDCDTPGECTASTIRETFHVVVVAAQGAQPGSFVDLAQVGIPGLAIDTSVRRIVYTNLLWQQTRILRYVSGDGQSAIAGATLGSPLVVELVDLASQPLSGVAVLFQPGVGMGQAGSGTTDAQGRAQANWTLGTSPGAQQLTASVTGSALTVDFHAIAL